MNDREKIIHTITEWPNHDSTELHAEKVPSKISYKDGRPLNWGYTVEPQEEYISVTKWLVKSRSEVARSCATELARVGKTADEIVTDYIELIWQHGIKNIEQHVGSRWRSVYMMLILTIPTIHSGAIIFGLQGAAYNAGLPAAVRVVREPEAATIAAFRHKSVKDHVSSGHCIILCDIGYAALSLTSYEVCDLSPLQLKECARPIGTYQRSFHSRD